MTKSSSDHERALATYLKRWSQRAPTRRPGTNSRMDPPPVEKPSLRKPRFRPRFTPVSKAEYWELLEILPPLGQSAKGFLVGERWSHRACHVTGRDSPTFQAVVERGKQYWKSLEGITYEEWRALDPVTLDVL